VRRIVSLAPNLTEIVFALGAGDRLVGVSSHSDFPPAARRLPVVGGVTPDLERVVSLRPDLVLATADGNSPRTVRRLEEQGIPVLYVQARDLPGVIRSIRRIGARIGEGERAAALSRSLTRRMEAAEKLSAERRRPRAILLIWPDPPQAAGRDTFGNDLLRRAGAENVVSRPGWPVLSPEFLLSAAIEVVVYPVEDDTREAFRRAFAGGPVSRLASGREVERIGVAADRLTRPGPRAFDGLEELAQRISRIVR